MDSRTAYRELQAFLRATPRERDVMVRTARRSGHLAVQPANHSRMTQAELDRLFPWLVDACVSARKRGTTIGKRWVTRERR